VGYFFIIISPASGFGNKEFYIFINLLIIIYYVVHLRYSPLETRN